MGKPKCGFLAPEVPVPKMSDFCQWSYSHDALEKVFHEIHGISRCTEIHCC